MSSQIEGTQAMLEDVLNPMLNENANRDVADVVNYIKATDYAIARLTQLGPPQQPPNRYKASDRGAFMV